MHKYVVFAQGSRDRKLKARAIRQKKEKLYLENVDVEEAKFQAIQRREAIDRAKTQQYYQTDRVKNFHVSIILL